MAKKASRVVSASAKQAAVNRAYARSGKTLRLSAGQGKAIIAARANGHVKAGRGKQR